ncbi:MULTISPECIES: helix-turn-helix domain-containing protein [unclassified Nocardia]|uniref:helix-turn-helix domain-containing protein n=1 Tax=unclassified Nocardia TaxID=2637762 RepID=UPI001CE442D6|nr:MULTISPECIES: helix-turn-helix transcriptional regulator [unclassified Nocardia]
MSKSSERGAPPAPHADREPPSDPARWQGLGDVVHHRRLAAGLTLAQLSTGSGLSASFLSQLENGRTNASLRSLQQISDALGTTATELLAAADADPDALLVRAGDSLAQERTGSDGTVRALVHGARDLRALEFTGGTTRGTREFAHDNDELIYVVHGSITVVADGIESTLSTGDAYYCAGGSKHRWWAHTPETKTLLFAVADGLVVRRATHRPR